ncbi:MAG: DNA-3-methyladenine glycosylase [Pyrinomonadaceae bacterium]
MAGTTQRIDRQFYLREDTLAIARDLLGKLIVVPDETGRSVSGMIIETEAYLGETDRAAHTYGGRRTARTEAAYALGGHVYVFFVYGMYNQLNVVCGPVDHPHVVLLRGVEPVEGIDTMRKRRGDMKDKNLTSGPGKLCIALGITKALNRADLMEDLIWLEHYRSFTVDEIAVGKRIGIDYSGEDVENPWRFWVRGNGLVSRK